MYKIVKSLGVDAGQLAYGMPVSAKQPSAMLIY